MVKDERIGFRIPADVKRALARIARKEGRSLAQVCEIFLKGGIDGYKKEGSRYLYRYLARQKKEEGSSD